MMGVMGRRLRGRKGGKPTEGARASSCLLASHGFQDFISRSLLPSQLHQYGSRYVWGFAPIYVKLRDWLRTWRTERSGEGRAARE